MNNTQQKVEFSDVGIEFLAFLPCVADGDSSTLVTTSGDCMVASITQQKRKETRCFQREPVFHTDGKFRQRLSVDTTARRLGRYKYHVGCYSLLLGLLQALGPVFPESFSYLSCQPKPNRFNGF